MNFRNLTTTAAIAGLFGAVGLTAARAQICPLATGVKELPLTVDANKYTPMPRELVETFLSGKISSIPFANGKVGGLYIHTYVSYGTNQICSMVDGQRPNCQSLNSVPAGLSKELHDLHCPTAPAPITARPQ